MFAIYVMPYISPNYHLGDLPFRRDARDIYDNEFVVSMLRSRQLKATPSRIMVIEQLLSLKDPITSSVLEDKLVGKLDRATIYRTLNSFFDAGLIDKIDFKKGQTHYEVISGKKHHHYAVCRKCSDIETVNECFGRELHDMARNGLKKFKGVDSHSLAFFGICRKCEK